MYTVLQVRYPLFLSEFNETWIFVTDLQRIFKHQLHPEGAELSHSDGQMDRPDEANTRSMLFCTHI